MRKPNSNFVDIVPADVAGALDDLGIDYVIGGDEAHALCPNPKHADSSPSWSCNLESGANHCWSCGYGGSFTRLVADVQGGRFDQAQVWIRTHRVRSSLDGVEIVTRAKERRAAEVRESDLWLCIEPPCDELAARAITPDAARKTEVLWHREKNCWIFPVRDPGTGKLLGWQEKSQRRFVNRPPDMQKHRSLFGLPLVRSAGTKGYSVVVESPLDVARFVTAGIDRVVSTYGSEFTDAQIDVLWDCTDVIIFALDNDLAGQRKVARWIDEHPQDRKYCRVFDYGTTLNDRFNVNCIVPEGDGRDPGNLSDDELRWGVDHATSAWRTYFEVS
jgi:Toprim-like/CHC2 zinc finger